MSRVKTTQNLSPADIRAELNKRGWNFADVDREYSLATGTASLSARYPNSRAEAAIAKVLGRPACQIWPLRYDRNGRRLRPQPKANYSPARVVVKRKKRKAA